jgi:hypothetical protein
MAVLVGGMIDESDELVCTNEVLPLTLSGR